MKQNKNNSRQSDNDDSDGGGGGGKTDGNIVGGRTDRRRSFDIWRRTRPHCSAVCVCARVHVCVQQVMSETRCYIPAPDMSGSQSVSQSASQRATQSISGTMTISCIGRFEKHVGLGCVSSAQELTFGHLPPPTQLSPSDFKPTDRKV